MIRDITGNLKKNIVGGGSKLTLVKKFKAENAEYVYMKLNPDTSVKNNNSPSIAKAIVNMYGGVQKKINKLEKQGIVQGALKCSYFIDMRKEREGNVDVNKVDFYLIVPKVYEAIIKEKVRSVWSKITITYVDEIPNFSNEKIAYQLKYKNVDALSLDVDKRSNVMLGNILNSLDIMDDGDRVGVFYNFIPIAQEGWRKEYKEGIDKFNSGQSLSNTKSLDYLKYVVCDVVQEVVDSTLDGIRDAFDAKPTKSTSNVDDLKKALYESLDKPSELTIAKKNKNILGVQTVVMSESSRDSDRASMVANTVAQSFSSISNDNELVYRNILGNLKDFNYTDSKLKFVDIAKCSVDECHNFLQLPGKDLIEQHQLSHINVMETKVPEDLRGDYEGNPSVGDCRGHIYLGDNVYRGMITSAYMSGDDTNMANLGLVVLGPQGAGKSKFFGNYAVNAINKGESVIIPDFIGNCQLCDEIASLIPKNKQVWLDMTIPESSQGFVFNEVMSNADSLREIRYTDERTGINVVKSVERQKRELSDNMTQASTDFIDSISTDSSGITGALSGKMRKVFTSACKIVFIHQDTSLYDVRECIRNVDTRYKFRNAIPKSSLSEYKEELEALSEIDEYDKSGEEIVGTKYSNIQYIIDRIDRLMERSAFKDMVKKNGSENVDLIKLMDEGKAIFIRIPEDVFSSQTDKNILTTFYIAKIWLSCQIRFSMHLGKQKRINVILDEIFQAPNTYKILISMLRQTRKFRCKFVFSAHYLNAIKDLRDALWGGGCSYMILGGSDKRTYEELLEELKPFTLEDLMSIPRFSAVCLMMSKESRKAFTVKLPKPIVIT